MSNLIEDILYDSGCVRRTDLKLRTIYYGLNTRIFLICKNHYAIQILNYIDMYEQIKKDFDFSIRRICSWIDLVKDEPSQIMRVVEPLQDVSCDYEGIGLTQNQFESLLVSRFVDVDFISVDVKHEKGIILIVTVDKTTQTQKIENIKEFLKELKDNYTEIHVVKSEGIQNRLYVSEPSIACTDTTFEFSKRDSEFWFDNVKDIYTGKMQADSLCFFEPSKSNCYLDFSVWENEAINIRSALLLYDKIYISLPLNDYYDNFLQSQNLTEKDIEELVEREKLVAFLPNTENRYNRKVLDRLYQINPNAVVSKRGINALMAMFYCNLESNYCSIWRGHEDDLRELSMECFKSTDPKAHIFQKWLLWPIKAKHDSFELLTNYSPIAFPSIGANILLEDTFSKDEQGKSIEFEFGINSAATHIASALNATYFPFLIKNENGKYSDEAVATILGGIINSYKYISCGQYKSIEQCTRLLEKEKNKIYLLDPNNSVNLRNFIDTAERYNTTEILKAILSNLMDSNAEEREEQIKEYNNLIAEIGQEKHDVKSTLFEYILTGAGFLPGIGTFASVISAIIEVLNTIRAKEHVVENKIVTGRASIEDEVYYLDKLSRVARLKL